MACLLPGWAYAQVNLSGMVQHNGAPAAFANVVLVNPAGRVEQGALTQENGRFRLAVQAGRYTIRISYVGLAPWERVLQLARDTSLGVVMLKEQEGLLKEVVVTGGKKLVEQQPDRLIFNVANSIAAVGGNALNAIGAAPGVLVQHNVISMLGKGASRVMINGRMIALTGEDLAAYLSSISAADISNIEVITNPPARYDAAGAGGLININLKKGAANAWKHTTVLSYDQNAYAFYSLRNSFLYQRNNLRLAAAIGGKTGYMKTREELKTYYVKGLWQLGIEGKEQQQGGSGSLAVDYDFTDKLSAGIQYAGQHNNPDRPDVATIAIHDEAGGISSYLINRANNDIGSTSHTLNAHLIAKLDTLGRRVSVDLDRFIYRSGIDNRFAASSYSPQMDFLITEQMARNVADQNIYNTSVTADVEYPTKMIRFNYGGKLSFITSKSGGDYYNTISGNPVKEKERSNRFDYREYNQAVYASGSTVFKKGMSLQLGLRLEHTTTEGASPPKPGATVNSYLKLFPSLSFSYKINADHGLVLNYGRRITRPGFRDLNPYRSYLSSKSYSEGNPFLQPALNDNFDVAYTYKGKFRTNAFLNITSNGFGVIFMADRATNTQTVVRQNYYREYAFGIGENFTGNITPWWENSTDLYLLSSRTLFHGIQAVPVNGAQLYVNTVNAFSLSRATKLQADFLYSSPFKKGLYEIGYRARVNFGVKHSMMNNRLQLAAFVNDIFNTAYLKDYNSVVNSIRQEYSQNNSSRYFRLSLTCQLGKSALDIRKRSGGNDEERKRAD